MRSSVKTLLEAKRVGLQLVAVCHNLNCRKQQPVDLDAVISYVGAQHEMLPVLNVRHFSERMVCPHCNLRGMFVWPVVNGDAEPNIEDALFSIKLWEKDGRCTSACETKSFKIAVAAYAAAVLENPKVQVTLQERARVLRDSERSDVVETKRKRQNSNESVGHPASKLLKYNTREHGGRGTRSR